MHKSTLKNLSETLGISISTVSRALKDHPDISEATKTKVKELAEVLDYEPNSQAVQLRTQKTNVLGVLVPTINNFFYDSFISAVEEEARKNGYSILIMQSRDDLDIENANLHFFRKGMVSGLFAAITIATDDMMHYEKLIEKNIPIVFIDRVPDDKKYQSICFLDDEVAKIAASEIVSKNKKNVLGLFGHPHLSITKIRHKAFLKVFEEKAPDANLHIEFTEDIENSRVAALAVLRSKKIPEVIFCMGDQILIGVMKAIHEVGLKVPDNISVIAISNGFIPGMYSPAITYVETSGYKLGRAAFYQMMAKFREEVSTENVCVESVLVNGGSLV